MHRSGTSLITQWLHKCGLHVGDELVGSGTGNEDGHFEDIEFLQAHELILKRRHLDTAGYTNPVHPLATGEKDILQGIVSFKNDNNIQWAWKDPRTCLFLDTYRELLPDAFYLVVLRDYESVVSSLIFRIYKRTEKKYSTRRGLSKFIWEHIKKRRRLPILLKKYSQRYLAIWIAYNKAILAHLQQIPRDKYIVTDYKNLSQCDKAVFAHLATNWGFELDYCDFASVYKEKLLHAASDIQAYIKDKSLLASAAEVEASLLQLIFFSGKKEIVVV